MLPIYTIVFIAFVLNFAGGYYKAGQIKFSSVWFLGVYIPLFLLIAIVVFSKTTAWVFLPCMMTLALGQFVGKDLRQSRLTAEEMEKIEQVADLQLPRELPPGIKDEQIVVVLMNMGGPTDQEAIEPFLRRLFNDDLILRFPFAQSFFADILIRTRLKEVKSRYQLIGGGSPILASSNNQVAALKTALQKRGRSIDVLLSFNYSEPLPAATIAEIKKLGKKYILPLSLYPHYSLSTTASNIFYLKEEAQKSYPELQFLESYSYHLYEGYIQAFVERIKETLKPGENLDDFYLLFSTHGTPLYFVEEGDPYAYLVSQTISRVVGELKRKHSWSTSYQSAVGPLVWLKPSTDAALKALADRKVKKLIVIPIAFVTDHIETLCEIDIEYRHMAKEQGIEDFRMSRAIECHPGFISALADCVETSLNK